MKLDPQEILNLIAQTIFDKKGSNILALDVHAFSTITDYTVIAEGNVDRHVVGIANAVIDALEKIGERPIHVEGRETGDWVVIDYLNIMVHIFMPGVREKYHLEDLWRQGEIVDLKIDIPLKSQENNLV